MASQRALAASRPEPARRRCLTGRRMDEVRLPPARGFVAKSQRTDYGSSGRLLGPRAGAHRPPGLVALRRMAGPAPTARTAPNGSSSAARLSCSRRRRGQAPARGRSRSAAPRAPRSGIARCARSARGSRRHCGTGWSLPLLHRGPQERRATRLQDGCGAGKRRKTGCAGALPPLGAMVRSAQIRERAMEFQILGPLEVIEDGRELSIRGRKLQALLVLLLLNAGETVSRDRLIAELWGDDPPATAAKTLQVHVSRLRRELGDAVVTRGGGYSVNVPPHGLDLRRFEALVAEGRAALAEHRPEEAERRLRDALALWRGPALPELADEPFAGTEIGRLEQMRLDAVEDHTEAELSLGRHAQAIDTLDGLVARHPYRERPRALLMLALYRSGRQADALDAYRDARRVLVEELGIEPGPQLRELQEAILTQDPALDGARGHELASPAAASTPSAVPPPARRRISAARRRLALPLAGLVALLVAAAALVTVALTA